MPLGPGVTYRMRGKVRLAFKNGEVVEAKNMDSGATHTPEEFNQDKKKKQSKKHDTILTKGGY